VHRCGWCVASWQPEVVAVSTPLMRENDRGYVLNASVSSAASPDDVAADLNGPLLALARQIAKAFEARERAGIAM
jgi:hypothetical protein